MYVLQFCVLALGCRNVQDEDQLETLQLKTLYRPLCEQLHILHSPKKGNSRLII